VYSSRADDLRQRVIELAKRDPELPSVSTQSGISDALRRPVPRMPAMHLEPEIMPMIISTADVSIYKQHCHLLLQQLEASQRACEVLQRENNELYKQLGDLIEDGEQLQTSPDQPMLPQPPDLPHVSPLMLPAVPPALLSRGLYAEHLNPRDTLTHTDDDTHTHATDDTNATALLDNLESSLDSSTGDSLTSSRSSDDLFGWYLLNSAESDGFDAL
jgi:hypothetical protein